MFSRTLAILLRTPHNDSATGSYLQMNDPFRLANARHPLLSGRKGHLIPAPGLRVRTNERILSSHNVYRIYYGHEHKNVIYEEEWSNY